MHEPAPLGTVPPAFLPPIFTTTQSKEQSAGTTTYLLYITTVSKVVDITTAKNDVFLYT
jgi:hypothetical protein